MQARLREAPMDALGITNGEAATLFSATLLLIVFFLMARVAQVRQPIALAFAMMPLLLTWAAQGLATASAGLV
jgi:hypothetical protein